MPRRMRLLIPLVVVLLVPVVGSPPAASAVAAAGSLVIDGPQVAVALPSGQSTDLTFSWNGEVRVLVKFFGLKDMFVEAVDGFGSIYGRGVGGSIIIDGTLPPFTPRTPDRLRLHLVADRDGFGRPGSVTVELDGVAPAFHTLIGVNGGPVTVSAGMRPNAAWFSTAGSVGQNLTIDLSSTGMSFCQSSVRVRRPDNTLLVPGAGLTCHPGTDEVPLGRLTQSGRYRVEIEWHHVSPPPPGTLSVRVREAAPALPPVCIAGLVSPIALVHGFGGSTNDFDDVRPFLVDRVKEEFRRAGATATEAAQCAPVFVTAMAVGPQTSSDANAAQVRQQLFQIQQMTGVTPIDIIAHSKGGLDSRTAIEHGTTIRNLVMIATPNGGTLLADVGCGAYNLPLGSPLTDPVEYLKRLAARTVLRRVVERIAGKCSGEQDALWGLTRDFVRQDLNPRVQDNRAVRYHTIAGDSNCIACRAFGIFVGPNDGLVPVSSVEFLASRGHNSAGDPFPDTHSGLLTSRAVAERAYCSLPPRGRNYPPCDVQPGGSSASAVAADAPDALLHFDAAEISAAGTTSRPLPIGGRGPVDVVVVTDQTGVTASAGGTAFAAEPYLGGRALAAHLTSATDLSLALSNPGGQVASALVMVFGAPAAGLNLRVTPEVAAPGQPVELRVAGAPAGLLGTVTGPDGTETVLTFTASGTEAVASFTPAAPGEYAVSVTHQGTVRRVAFDRIVTGTGVAALPGTVAYSLQTGSDGLADALNADVTIALTQAGFYTLSAGLAAADGTVIGTAESSASLGAGQQPLRLGYRGPVLYAAAKNGPYHLVDITVERGGAVEAQRATTAPTAAYPFTTFRPALVVPAAASVTEGDSGTKIVEFPVTLTERVNVPVTTDFVSIVPAGAATWPEDYHPVWSRLTFLPGETSKTVSLTIKGDTRDEPDEAALVQFYAATNAKVGGFGGVGGVTIVDDDPAPVIQPGFVSVTEGNTVVQVPVTLSAPSGRTVTVNYGSVEPPGYATWPEDYDPVLGTLTFQPGETSKTIALTIKGDTLNEPDEVALIQLSGATNATIGGFAVAGVTIVDDDPAPVIQPGFVSVTEGLHAIGGISV